VLFGVLIAALAIAAGAVASVSGFGIGSLLTPALAVRTGTKLAVAAVTIPHCIGSAQRLWILRRQVDRRVLLGFGAASAIGGLAGALAHTWITSRALAVVFGLIVAIAGIAELTRWVQHVRWGRAAAWIAGALSGALGGLVGNQGGIRTAAMLGFDVPKESFVATAAAIALVVDGARLPVYLATEWRGIVALWPMLVLLTVAVVLGTILGTRLLTRLPQQYFRRVIGALLVLLGVYMVAAGRG
jgi:uncharacterized membrane protein YfcA